MQANKETESAVMAVFDRFREAYELRDEQALLSVVAPDPDIVMFGTGVDEKRIGPAEILAQAKRDWAQSEATSLDIGWHQISATGAVAWLAADVAFKVKAASQEMTLPGRLTAVFEQRNSEWLLVQSHFSLPTPGQAEGESFPT
jgi:ketosteroid isomerase-like protein